MNHEDKLLGEIVDQEEKISALHAVVCKGVARGRWRVDAGGTPIHRLRRVPMTDAEDREAASLRVAGMTWINVARSMRLSRSAVMRGVARHMKSKHPEFGNENVVKLTAAKA